MTGRRAGFWTLLLELAMLAASLRAGGPIADGVRVIGLIVVGMVGALVVFVAAVFAPWASSTSASRHTRCSDRGGWLREHRVRPAAGHRPAGPRTVG